MLECLDAKNAKEKLVFLKRCMLVVAVTSFLFYFNQAVASSNNTKAGIANTNTASPEPDVFNAPGINNNRYYDRSNSVLIDTFSGTLQAQYVDLVVPGKGVDIVINRSYNSGNDRYSGLYHAGYRWDVHFGYTKEKYNLCKKAGFGDYSRFIFVKPDGGHQTFVKADHFFVDVNANRQFDANTDYRPAYISSDLWRGECNGVNMVVSSPDGIQYTIGDQSVGFRVTQISDQHDNVVNITYNVVDKVTKVLPKKLRASDGRIVDFSYNANNQLIAINSQGKSVKYSYLYRASDNSLSFPYLTTVTLPDKRRWLYEYEGGSIGFSLLKTVVSPLGEVQQFKYGVVKYVGTDYPSVINKCVDSSCWNYTYAETLKAGKYGGKHLFDSTTIEGPDGKKVYYHHGVKSTKNGDAWIIGLADEIHTFSPAGVLIREENNWWDKVMISNVKRSIGKNGKVIRDLFYAVPVLQKSTVLQDGELTTYENLDKGALVPDHVSNTGSSSLESFTGFDFVAEKNGHWLLHLPTEKAVKVGTGLKKNVSTASYNAQGLIAENLNKGILTKYAYHPSGEVSSITDGVNNVTQYANYHRGVARKTTYPDATVSTRTVDNWGRITSETDARGRVTRYQYDSLDRITLVDYPLSADLKVRYDGAMLAKGELRLTFPQPMTLSYKKGGSIKYTKGKLEVTQIYNTRNQIVRSTQKDITSGKTLVKRFQYDPLSRLKFKSYVNEQTKGVNLFYDDFNRVVKTQTTDGIIVKKNFVSASVTELVDAKSQVTTYRYETFSHDDKRIKSIEAPEGVVIDITRNELGQPLTISQNGLVREYGYDKHWALTSYKEPEKPGNLGFAYNAAGQKTEEWIVDASGKIYKTLFTFDKMGRVNCNAFRNRQAIFPKELLTLVLM